MILKDLRTDLSLFWRVIGRKYIKSIALLSSLSIFSGLSGSLGIGSLIPIFSFIVKGNGFGEDIVSKNIGLVFQRLNIVPQLSSLIILICIFFIAKAFFDVFFGYLNATMIADLENVTRRKVHEDMLHSQWSYLLKQKIGHFHNIIMANLGYGFAGLSNVSKSLIDITSFVIYSILSFLISPIITIFMLVSGLLFLIASRPLAARIKRYAAKRTTTAHAIARYVNENVVGLKTIKAMGAEDRVLDLLNKLFDNFTFARKKLSLVKSIGIAGVQPITIIFISIVFFISYKFTHFDLGIFVATIFLIQRNFIYVEKIQDAINSVHNTAPYLKAVSEVQDELIKYREPEGGHRDFAFNHDLVFKNVAFSYNSDKSVLKNVSFKIKKGEIVGIVGPSGVGKTTIVDLFLRLLDSYSGEILLDDVNIREINLKEWRKNTGYVSQDVFLKNTTIEQNIKFYDEGISDEQMIEAVKMTGIYDFIISSPMGFQTVVGDRGIFLSGGQRQRIALARALVRKPKILILDEATSSLDNESEILIDNTINKLRDSMTIITIAHRLTTVMGSDRIIVLRDGRVAETGSPKELLANKDSYFYKVSNIR